MQVKLFRDAIQYGRQVAILFWFLHIQRHYSHMVRPISFNHATRAIHYDLHMHVKLFSDTIQYGHQAAILFQFLIMYPTWQPTWSRVNVVSEVV